MLLRDILQFVFMLVLVRLLSPEDYGRVALAQTIIGVVSVFSFGTLILHALQDRNPDNIDWQSHFSAGVVINSILVILVLSIAVAISSSATYEKAAAPLAGLSVLFVIEVVGTLRHRMLEVQHDWKRFRILLILGTALALVVGILVAWLGGGIWALVVQPPLFGLPAAIDLLFIERWRPNWSWSWAKYREVAIFGYYRMGAATVLKGRLAAEQGFLTSSYDFSTLGVFTRSQGLGTLVAGRIGTLATTTLYPILTRAEQGSARFRQMAGMLLRGVCWTTIPAAVFLALYAEGLVDLIYGPQWSSVTELVPSATAVVAIGGLTSAISNLLLANNQARSSLGLELLNALFSLIAALALIPIGLEPYLVAVSVLGVVILLVALYFLHRARGIDFSSIYLASLPPLLASLCAGAASQTLLGAATSSTLIAAFFIFSTAYLIALRFMFSRSLRELLQVLPGGMHGMKLLRYR